MEPRKINIKSNAAYRGSIQRSIAGKIERGLGLLNRQKILQGDAGRILTCLKKAGEILSAKYGGVAWGYHLDGGVFLGISLGGSFSRGLGSKKISDVDYLVFVNGKLSADTENEFARIIDEHIRLAGYIPCDSRHFYDMTSEALADALDKSSGNDRMRFPLLAPFTSFFAFGDESILRSRVAEALPLFAAGHPESIAGAYKGLKETFFDMIGLNAAYFLKKARQNLGNAVLSKEEWAYLDRSPQFAETIKKRADKLMDAKRLEFGLPEDHADFIKIYSLDQKGSYSIPYRKITFVCTGNHVRSFMMEAALKHVASQELPGIQSVISFRSAGIELKDHQARLKGEGVTDPSSPNPEAAALLQARGIDCSGFSKTGLTQEIVDGSDLILAMTERQKALVENNYLRTKGKLLLAKEFAGYKGEDMEVHVPKEYGEETWDDYEQIADDLLKKLLPDQVLGKLPVLPLLPDVPRSVRDMLPDYSWTIPTFSAKGWLSVNYFIRCTMGCIYCFARHRFKASDSVTGEPEGTSDAPVELGRPIQLFTEEDVARHVLEHPYFRADIGAGYGTPLGIHTGTTEAFLPQVKGSTFKLLDILDKQGIKNDVAIITKFFLTLDDIKRLEDVLRNLRLNIMVCYSANPRSVEPNSTKTVRDGKLKMIDEIARRSSPHLRVFHYMRPLAIGWNTTEEALKDSLRFGERTQAIVIGGIALTNLTQQVLDCGADLPGGPYPDEDRDGWERYGPGKKFMPRDLIERILGYREELRIATPLVRRSSCAVSLANAAPDYNAHRIDDPKNCLSSCPLGQQQICASAKTPPSVEAVKSALDKMGFPQIQFSISDSGVILDIAKSDAFSNIDAFGLRHLIRFPVKFGRGPK